MPCSPHRQNLRIFRRVTDPPEDGRLASIRALDDKDPETAEFLLKIFEITGVFCRHSVEAMSEER